MLSPDQLVLVYDGTCGFCSTVARWMMRLDWRHTLMFLPSQTPGLREAVRLTPEQAERAAWAVLPTGERREGAAAIFAGLDALLPLGPPFLSSLYRLPGFGHLSDRVYDWVARNRSRFAGTPTCDLGPPPPLTNELRQALMQRVTPTSIDPQ